jgi:hypothetical protein
MTDLTALATRAYVYGYPMVYDLTEVGMGVSGARANMSAPYNTFWHGRTLAGPAENFVSINNDTLYSIVQGDVSEEPQVLHLPATNDRYSVMQFVDAWTNNFAYLGRRATGTDEQTWLLAAPGWDGDLPEGVRVITAPTTVFTIVGRYAVDGEADLPAVHRLQDDTWLTPLSRYPERTNAGDLSGGERDPMPWNRDVDPDLVWWEKFRFWSQLYPPADPEVLASFAALGVLEKDSPYVDPDPALRAALVAAQEQGQQQIDEIASHGFGDAVNGWSSALHSFDYNVSRFEVGTIDAPEWKIADPVRMAITRAAAARGGLWGNHGYEAAYYASSVDANGDLLTGERRYILHFDQVPPVDAFWSITMYDTPNYYLVENPIDRYSIGDRTPDLVYNEDGSLDIHVQTDDPGDEKRSNWLPSPAGVFRPLIRMYQPQAPVLEGNYVLPPFTRIDS